jgi:hypothetical protein
MQLASSGDDMLSVRFGANFNAGISLIEQLQAPKEGRHFLERKSELIRTSSVEPSSAGRKRSKEED